MRRPSIVLTESAIADIEGVVAGYTEQGVPAVGRRLVAEILGRIEALIAHPELGRVVPEFNQPQVRELIHPPFRIVYRYATNRSPIEIQIVRVWRSERLLKLEPTGDEDN